MKDLVVLYLSNDFSQVYASFISAYVALQIVIVLLQVPNTLVQISCHNAHCQNGEYQNSIVRWV
jgi:hypothetical protein